MKLPVKEKRNHSLSVNVPRSTIEKLNLIVEETKLPKGRIIEEFISQYKLLRNHKSL